MLTTQLMAATSLTDDKGLAKQQNYLFSFQIAEDGVVRIITTDDIEVFYPTIHDFFISWARITSLGWAKDKEQFAEMLAELKQIKDENQ